MKEMIEFRVLEEHAGELFAPGEGKCLGDSVRVVKVPAGDKRLREIQTLQRKFRAAGEGDFFYAGWDYHRSYTIGELESAELFTLESVRFEPAGEECGTVYDESKACVHCGAGGIQVGDLILDLRTAPKRADLACTIADECIVSQRLAELLVDEGVSGFELRRVRHKARYQDDPKDFRDYPTGRLLLQMARQEGLVPPSWEFYVWLNRPERAELLQRVDQEHISTMISGQRRPSAGLPRTWYQLLVNSHSLPTVAPTRFGIDPFDEDPASEYRCPLGHVSGLNLLSEIFVSRKAWDGSDIVQTKDMYGIRRGLLRPAPAMLISQRLRRALMREKIRGFKLDVAHLA
jgi:hypothetical protein